MQQSTALSDIEELKKNLAQRTEKQMDFIFQNFEKTDKNKKVIARMMMTDIIGAEKDLQDEIEEFIKKE